jgi:hypothetical protein
MRGEHTTASNNDTLAGQRGFNALLQHLHHNTCITKQFLPSSVIRTQQLRTSLNSLSDSIARRTRSSFKNSQHQHPPNTKTYSQHHKLQHSLTFLAMSLSATTILTT